MRRGPTDVRRAVLATVLLFVTNGAVFGAVVPRLPELKDALGLDAAAFGVAMACYPAGALVGGLASPLLFRRASDGSVAVATMIGASLAGGIVAFAPTVVVFGAVLVAFGVCDAITDVAMNAHGIRAQVRAGRSLINRFHAMWSFGAVAGALVGSAAAGLGATVTGQMLAVGLVCAALSLLAYPLRLPGGPRAAREAAGPGVEPAPAAPRTPLRSVPPRVWLSIVGLGLLACCAELVEDFAQTWSALYLRDVVGVGAGLAGAGFVAVQGMQLLGRLTGDRLTEALGTVRVGWTGGICVTLGTGATLLASATLHGTPLLVVALLGLGLAGWGIATVIPGAMVACDAAPGLSAGVGLGVLNWVMRLGLLLSPPAVGFLAQHAGLRWTVAPMVVGGVLVVVLSVALLGLAEQRHAPRPVTGPDTAPDPSPGVAP